MCLDLHSPYRALQVIVQSFGLFRFEFAAYFPLTAKAGILILPLREPLHSFLSPLLLLKAAFKQNLLFYVFLSLSNCPLVLLSFRLSQSSPGGLTFEPFTVASQAINSLSFHPIRGLTSIGATGSVKVKTKAGKGLGSFEGGNRERADRALGYAVTEEAVQGVVSLARLVGRGRGGAALDVEKSMEEGKKRGNGQSPVLA